MCGIHDIFPSEPEEADNPIALRKLFNGDGTWDTIKAVLGFIFNGEHHTMWLSEGMRKALISTITGWLRSSRKNKTFGILFPKFRSLIYKVRHAFIPIPVGKGLLSPFYKILDREPRVVFLQHNSSSQQALMETRTFLRDSITQPTPCRSLVTGWPNVIGV
jgi:hypothetical protein